MSLPIDRTAKSVLDANLVNGILSDGPKIKASNDAVYNTIDELNNKVDANRAAGNTGTTQLADGSVTTAKHADGSVTTAKIADSAVTLAKMADSSVGTTELVDLAVTNGKVANATLTADKFVAEALTNETQNGLRITAHMAEIAPHGELIVGKTIYVDIVNGNNGNVGNQAAPYKHINYALSMLKKNIYEPVTIRVLPGDYTSEGQILVQYFKVNTVTIQAFDGTNDISTLSDNYKIKKIGIYNCDWVILAGFRIMNTDADYGVYAQETKFLKCIAIKNIETSPTSDGFGFTFNTTAHLVGCLASGKGTVISSNNGSKVISESWDAGSTGNTTTLKAQWGSQIHKIGLQPVGTNNNEHINGGTLFEEDGSLWVARSYNKLVTGIDPTLTGTLTVTIDMPVPPKWIKIDACQVGSAAMCSGSWSKNAGTASQSSIARSNINGMFASFSIVHLTNDGTNTVQYEVASVTNNLLTLTITKTGAPTGNISLSLLCGS